MSWSVRFLACWLLAVGNLAALALVPLRPRLTDDEPGNAKQMTNTLGMKLVRIGPGTFLMGSPPTEPGRGGNEILHEVQITRPFYIGRHEVTQADYEKVMGTNPSYFSRTGQGKKQVGPDTRRLPVENVSWNDAKQFCRKLTEMDRSRGKIAAGMHYSLPTEAEWEYCCRAGSKTAYAFGELLSTDQANFNGANMVVNGKPGVYRNCPVAVGSFPPNAWGLCDMHGNINEWCEDWYDANYYSKSPRIDPPGAAAGQIRVLRGGSWTYHPNNCRSALRDGIGADFRGNFCGFRVVLRLSARPN